MKDVMKWFLLLFATLAMGVSGLMAANTETMGPLGSNLLLGKNGDWEGTLEGPTYVLKNRGGSGSVKYFYVLPEPAQLGVRELSVKVAIRKGDRYSHAGLLYGLKTGRTFYYAFVLEKDKKVSVYRRTENGMHRVSSSRMEEIKEEGFNELRIMEKGKEFEAYVNGTRILTLGSVGVGEGAVGIFAWRQGEFAYGDFQVRPEGSSVN